MTVSGNLNQAGVMVPGTFNTQTKGIHSRRITTKNSRPTIVGRLNFIGDYMIIDTLPTAITINNENYAVETDFRKWIEFETLLSAKTFSDNETAENIIKALMLVFPVAPPDIKGRH